MGFFSLIQQQLQPCAHSTLDRLPNDARRSKRLIRHRVWGNSDQDPASASFLVMTRATWLRPAKIAKKQATESKLPTDLNLHLTGPSEVIPRKINRSGLISQLDKKRPADAGTSQVVHSGNGWPVSRSSECGQSRSGVRASEIGE